jgi:hypothetical protein
LRQSIPLSIATFELLGRRLDHVRSARAAGALAMRPILAMSLPILLACGDAPGQPDGGPGGGGSGTTSTVAQSGSGAGGPTTAATGGSAPCPLGVTCVDSFPFTDERDTSTEGTAAIDSYACSPTTDEGGPEILYRVTVPADGFLSVAVYDGDGVDIDVHVLADLDPSAPDGSSCIDRGDLSARADVEAGTAWIVADTWVGQSGPLPGAFRIDIGFVPFSEGPCEMLSGSIDRVGDGGMPLAMPATGPVVRQPHLVTQEEPAPFPTSTTDELAEHFELSQARTGLVMVREDEWTPLEGADFYGAGIGDPADVPVEDEGWFVTMYWTPASRPPRGTRMILRRPDNPTHAVVVAAGYDTGPADLSRVGGASEEAFFVLRSAHDDAMELGFAADPSLPLGPRRCTGP